MLPARFPVKCVCAEWIAYIPQVTVSGVYVGPQFRFCPWCGNLLVLDEEVQILNKLADAFLTAGDYRMDFNS
jgi:hypothetical protein